MNRAGVWLIGARGSIAAVTLLGACAMRRGSPGIGLVTERAAFRDAGLVAVPDLVFGGHEVRTGSLREATRQVLVGCGLPGLTEAHGDALDAIDAEIRPGVVHGSGPRVHAEQANEADTDRAAIDGVRRDLDAFKRAHGLARLVVVNLASTEPPPADDPAWHALDLMQASLASRRFLPPSVVYAYAALQGGDAYVNFTPSTGSRPTALQQLAISTGAVHAGSDGKTGETLVKSVLAELFLRRNLPVLSWFGQNILGNEDGRVLDDPSHKAAKIRSKDHLLPKILGYPPETRVGIDYVASLGEWKIAWDNIHFEGFLGGRMSMQFTWNGCDSLLAAPLVLDLVRLIDLAQRRGAVGVQGQLAAFFKDPMGTDEQRLVSQDEALLSWIRSV